MFVALPLCSKAAIVLAAMLLHGARFETTLQEDRSVPMSVMDVMRGLETLQVIKERAYCHGCYNKNGKAHQVAVARIQSLPWLRCIRQAALSSLVHYTLVHAIAARGAGLQQRAASLI